MLASREYSTAKPIVYIICQHHSLLIRTELHYCNDWPKYLFLHQTH
eukprot:Gb_12472 [translate_table: standard]